MDPITWLSFIVDRYIERLRFLKLSFISDSHIFTGGLTKADNGLGRRVEGFRFGFFSG